MLTQHFILQSQLSLWNVHSFKYSSSTRHMKVSPQHPRMVQILKCCWLSFQTNVCIVRGVQLLLRIKRRFRYPYHTDHMGNISGEDPWMPVNAHARCTWTPASTEPLSLCFTVHTSVSITNLYLCVCLFIHLMIDWFPLCIMAIGLALAWWYSTNQFLLSAPPLPSRCVADRIPHTLRLGVTQ